MLTDHSSFHGYLSKAFIAGLLISLVSSCTVVKKYPHNKPFVYKTKINVIGNFPNDERLLLEERLENQLDDSMRAPSVNQIVRKVIKNPPVYESANADKSVLFMKALLVSLGYFYDSISYHADTVVEKPDKLPTTITFDVSPNKLTRLDSISYNIRDSSLQRLTMANLKESLLKKRRCIFKRPNRSRTRSPGGIIPKQRLPAHE